MKILSAAQIRELDQYTILNQPVASIDLMERAASVFFDHISGIVRHHQVIYIFCGMGNNGGDGLAVARKLVQAGYNHVHTYVVRHSPRGSEDFEINQISLKNISGIRYIETENQIPKIEKHAVIIDAIFGTGLSRPVEGIAASAIDAMNNSGATVYSIDVPSGLFCDIPNSGDDHIIRSNITLTFHAPKFSFMFAANAKYVPVFKVLDIGLMNDFAEQLPSRHQYITGAFIKSFFRKREKFSHKGTYGHALIACGSFGKMGAAVLCVRGALRSGAGLVTAHIPGCGYEILQSTDPEAMVIADESEKYLTRIEDTGRFSAIGVGPGIGTEKETENYLEQLLKNYKKPIVIDADALNIISSNLDLLRLVPPESVLTPHPGEFKRLAGDWQNDIEKFEKQIEISRVHKLVLVLKGAHTSVSTPEGALYFNSTGNPGMAKGGSGDVLTGIITALLAQNYSSVEAALTAVFVHGSAGDYANDALGETAMNASDILRFLPKAFKSLEE